MKVVLSVLLMSLSLLSMGQEEEFDYVTEEQTTKPSKKSAVRLPIKGKDPAPVYVTPSYARELEQEMNEEKGEGKKKDNRTRVGLDVGTSVASDFNGNSAINTYVAPHVSHQVDENITVSGGVVASQTWFDGWTGYNLDNRAMPSSLYTTMLYGRIDYKVNERMVVWGAVYHNLTTIPGTLGYDQNLSGTGYSVGMEYKISERSFLQVQVSRRTGHNPFVPYSTGYGFGTRPIGYFP